MYIKKEKAALSSLEETYYLQDNTKTQQQNHHITDTEDFV